MPPGRAHPVSGRLTADGRAGLAQRRPDIWPAADLALPRAVERVSQLHDPVSVVEVDALDEPSAAALT
jgi:hypothetical protein